VLRHPAPTDAARRALAAYLSGATRSVDVRPDLALASPFQREVLTGLAARVGYGERTTYAVLASAVEHPGAARAVGTALGANPLCIVLPCHRVLPASGGVGGYAGGPAAKEHLLALEAAHAA
jgi:methylated-DNA-[protein]-cysteine S-methyltransferase